MSVIVLGKLLVRIRGNKNPSPLVGRLAHGHICNTIVSITMDFHVDEHPQKEGRTLT